MKRRIILATVVLATLLVSVMGLSVLTGEMEVSAENATLEYSYFVSPGRALDNPDCDQDNADTAFANCPDMAKAAVSFSGMPNDQSVEIIGGGTLRIGAKDGKPKQVNGGGSFVHRIGEDFVGGTWEATKLLMFEPYGDAPGLDPTWRTGRALILVHLVDDAGTMEADAILEIGCRLPGNAGVSGTIEGIRLLIGGGLKFNDAADPRATLFVLTKGEDGF